MFTVPPAGPAADGSMPPSTLVIVSVAPAACVNLQRPSTVAETARLYVSAAMAEVVAAAVSSVAARIFIFILFLLSDRLPRVRDLPLGGRRNCRYSLSKRGQFLPLGDMSLWSISHIVSNRC